METSGGFLGRVGERVVSWIALGLLILLGIAIWRMQPETRTAIWENTWRTSVWVVLAAAIPWSGAAFMSRLLAVGSNWAGVALLGAYCVLDLGLGIALLRGWPAGGWGWFAALAALGVAGTYNYLVSEYLAERAGG
jgi:hypothetical protein